MQVLTALFRALLMVFLIASMTPAIAQESAEPAPQVQIGKKKLLVQPRGREGVQETAFLDDPILWMREKQQSFYRSIAGAIRGIKTGAWQTAAWTLMTLSFGYGVFHAAGPGHGKAVISSWLLATENELKRGILISFLSAIIQALSAILIVSILALFVSRLASSARDVAGFVESASYAMIGGLGLYLIWTAFRSSGHAHHHHEHHHHHHGHVHDEHCGHAHVPEASQVRGDWSLYRAFSISFAIGVRPCTGAILVLVSAYTLGIYWIGVLSALVMALGTFITVSVIAVIAVFFKKAATYFAAKDDRWLSWLAFGLRLGGGLVIAFLGGLLFLGSLGTSTGMV
ncbi:MAG: nickel/cobalt transporter [Rhizobiales bacterium]|nr:nickel/cobalt transporter [Hyphomicrobiales bacterium]